MHQYYAMTLIPINLLIYCKGAIIAIFNEFYGIKFIRISIIQIVMNWMSI